MVNMDNIIGHPDCYYNRTCRPMNISHQVPMEWAIPLYGYWMPFIVSLTVATNSFIVIVLSHKYLRTPTNYVLLAMAVSELFTGISCIPWFLYYFTLRGHEVEQVYGLPSVWCSILPYVAAVLPSIFHSTAIWLTVYLAIQRYVYICVPSLVQTFCTIKRSKQVTGAIGVFSFTIYSTEFFANYQFSKIVFDAETNSTRRNCYRQQTYLLKSLGNLYYEALYTIQCTIVHLVPCVLLVIFTWKLVRAIRMADERHANLLSRSVRRRAEINNRGRDATRISRMLRPRESVSEPRRSQGLQQNTRMLVVVIVIFLVTEIPAGIIFIIHVISVSMRVYIINYKLLNILLIVRNVAIVSSYPFRFAIYCGMSQQFRDVVKQMFTGRMIFRLVRDNDNSTTLAIVALADKESEERRSSIVLMDTNGRTRSSLTQRRTSPLSHTKATQFEEAEHSSSVPFDPYFSDLKTTLNLQIGDISELELSRTISTQCDTQLDIIRAHRNSSLISSALKEQTLQACEVMLSS